VGGSGELSALHMQENINAAVVHSIPSIFGIVNLKVCNEKEHGQRFLSLLKISDYLN
jgi:hypothetical protein